MKGLSRTVHQLRCVPALPFSIALCCHTMSCRHRSSLSLSVSFGFRALNRQSDTISSHTPAQACFVASLLAALLFPRWPLPWLLDTKFPEAWLRLSNHQIRTWSLARHSSVSMSRRLMAFSSPRRNSSRTMDSRFHIPSGS